MYLKILLWRYLGWNKYIIYLLFIYLFIPPRYLHNVIFRYVTVGWFKLSSSVTTWLYCQAQYPCSYSNQLPGSAVLGGFTATFLYWSLPHQVRAAAKILAGGVGEPLESFTASFTLGVANKLLQWRYLEWSKSLITLHQCDMARYFTLMLYFQAHENKLAYELACS